METVVSSKGQIVLPAEIRRKESRQEFEIERIGCGEYRLARLSPPKNQGFLDWTLTYPDNGFLVPVESESTDSMRRSGRREPEPKVAVATSSCSWASNRDWNRQDFSSVGSRSSSLSVGEISLGETLQQDNRIRTRKLGEGEAGGEIDPIELISVIVEGEEEAYPTRTLGGPISSSSKERAKELPVGKLRSSFGKLSKQVTTILQDVRQVGDLQLKEVQLQVEVNSEGGVSLIGNLKAGTKGAITLKFSA